MNQRMHLSSAYGSNVVSPSVYNSSATGTRTKNNFHFEKSGSGSIHHRHNRHGRGMNYTDHRQSTRISGKCPTRMFLSEVLNSSKNQFENDASMNSNVGTSIDVRLMGHVVISPSLCNFQSSKPMKDMSNPQNHAFVFIVDDGTACINVMTLADKGTIQDHNENTENHSQFKFQCNGLLPHEICMGDCIDCVGTIEFVKLSAQSEDPIPCLIVQTITKVSDPNIEILRMVELSSRTEKGHDYKGVESHNEITKNRLEKPENASSSWSRTYMYGDPAKLQPPTEEEQKAQLSHFIQLSKPDGGILEEDLALLLGIDEHDHNKRGGNYNSDAPTGTTQSRSVLKQWLECMQSNCEIYQTRDGSYLPL